jgi:hypothetical protein
VSRHELAARDCLVLWEILLSRMTVSFQRVLARGGSSKQEARHRRLLAVVQRVSRKTQVRLEAWVVPEWAVTGQFT